LFIVCQSGDKDRRTGGALAKERDGGREGEEEKVTRACHFDCDLTSCKHCNDKKDAPCEEERRRDEAIGMVGILKAREMSGRVLRGISLVLFSADRKGRLKKSEGEGEEREKGDANIFLSVFEQRLLLEDFRGMLCRVCGWIERRGGCVSDDEEGSLRRPDEATRMKEERSE